jgi:hypothetical protein
VKAWSCSSNCTLPTFLQIVTIEAVAVGLFVIAKVLQPLTREPLFDNEFDMTSPSKIPLLPIFLYVPKFPTQTLEEATNPAMIDPRIVLMCQSTANYLSTHDVSEVLNDDFTWRTPRQNSIAQDKKVDPQTTAMLEFLK